MLRIKKIVTGEILPNKNNILEDLPETVIDWEVKHCEPYLDGIRSSLIIALAQCDWNKARMLADKI